MLTVRGRKAATDWLNAKGIPLTAEQVGALAASIGERYPVYQLFTLFAAYTGLRAEELAGLEVGDLAFQPATTGPVGAVHVRRAKKRKPAAAQNGGWVTAPLKSTRSNRVVPLPGWLAAKLVDYLAKTHPHANDPSAPLWPNRALGGARRRGCRAISPLDWTEPIDCGAYYRNIMKPALTALGLPASKPATATEPAVHGVRLHDLRHTFAVLQLSAGKPFMLVSEWLGHSTYTLTLDVYGGFIPSDDAAANTLPEPVAPAQKQGNNVVPLRRVKGE
jgi:integrase